MPMQEKRKRPRHKLYQNCPECFGCFITELAVGNDAQLVDNTKLFLGLFYVVLQQILVFQPDVLS